MKSRGYKGDRLRRWLGEEPGHWLPGGLFGGAAGACAAAWLLWGVPTILGGALCFPVNVLAAGLLYIMAFAGGYSFLTTLQHVVRGIRYLRRPSVFAYYEPPSESFPELEIIGGPFPGCGFLILVPVMLLGLVISLPWFWFGPASVPFGRLLLTVLAGLPLGILLARGEHRREAKQREE
jgi:hypothetical protein